MIRTAKLVRSALTNLKCATFARKRPTTGDKVCASSADAIRDVEDGSSIASGGFGVCGIPENLFRATVKKNTKNLTLISNNPGVPGYGIGQLLENNQIKRLIVTYVGGNYVAERKYLAGEVELDLCPQGTLAEKLRAGAAGLPAFYTPTGVGTLVEYGSFPIKLAKDGKTPLLFAPPRERRYFNGREYIMERTLGCDFAYIKAWKADRFGNLIFRKTARNFNPDMAMCADCTIVEAEQIVETGTLNPEEIHIPGIFVDRVVKGEQYDHTYEKVINIDAHGKIVVTSAMKTKEDPKPKAPKGGKPGAETGASEAKVGDGGQKVRERIAKRGALEVRDGMYINLGIGIPTLIPNFVPQGQLTVIQSENGVLGAGPYPEIGKEDWDLINAGKETITMAVGASTFSSSASFSLMRGGHLAITYLGGLQVSGKADIASWMIPGKMGMGGAMDLVSSGSRVIVLMEHCNRNGESKILEECTLPLTGQGVVSMIITDMAVFEYRNQELYLKEIAKEYTLDDVIKRTACAFKQLDNITNF